VARVCSAVVMASLIFNASAAHGQRPERQRLGTVHFETSCSPRVAREFDHGVALLHSFEFGAAIQAFDRVLATDSTCAMAYWGIALSRWTNPMVPGDRPAALMQSGREAVTAARRLSARASARERGYIAAVERLYADFEHTDQRTRVAAYERAMGDLVMQEPADTEAVIFHALSLIATASPADKTYTNQLKAGAILEALWVKMPNHPGLAHYIIHGYDYPPLAYRARAAALHYAHIAPDAAHALHMPSHTFTRLGMWKESVRANTRSRAVALRSGSVAEALHASDYAMYADLQMGRDSDAKVILDGLPSIAAHFDPAAVTGAAPGSAGVFALAAIPARWVLERRAWREASALELHASAFPYADAMTYFARALGASHTKDFETARASVDSLEAIRQRLSARGEGYWAEQVSIEHLAASAWLDLAQHRDSDALVAMREAATREDATEKSAVSPGPLAPSRELLGDMLMALGRPDEARAEYRATLKNEPNRRHSANALSPHSLQ
jgi:tetratricopeptide (TPR) repeat protein